MVEESLYRDFSRLLERYYVTTLHFIGTYLISVPRNHFAPPRACGIFNFGSSRPLTPRYIFLPFRSSVSLMMSPKKTRTFISRRFGILESEVGISIIRFESSVPLNLSSAEPYSGISLSPRVVPRFVNVVARCLDVSARINSVRAGRPRVTSNATNKSVFIPADADARALSSFFLCFPCK